MVLSKSDLRDPLNPLFWVQKKIMCIYKNILVPIDHHVIFKMFKLNFCGSDKKSPKIIFLNPFLGHFQKSLTGSESMCRSIMASSFKRWSKKSSSLKKSAILMVKMAKKMPETCDEIFLDPQNPLFCIKDKKLYIQNVGHIWAYIHANSQDF